MSDSKLMAGKAAPKDYQQELSGYLFDLCVEHGADNNVVNTTYVPFSRFAGTRELEDGFLVEQDVYEPQYVTIHVTLEPWQAKQAIEFLRNLPKEPEE